MKSKITSFAGMALLTIMFISCAKKDPKAEVKSFVSSFAAGLTEADSIILRQFKTDQSSEAIIAGIRILQNNQLGDVTCVAFYDDAVITFENEGISVKIPTSISSSAVPDLVQTDSVTLWLIKKNDSFVITKFDGEKFFNGYLTITNTVDYQLHGNALVEGRVPYYEKAKELQKNYDSIIWYTSYGGKDYFYAVKGVWNNPFVSSDEQKPITYSMGLVDQDGKEIVPVEFDLVGTPGIAMEDVVEVRKNNKYGYYSLTHAKNIVPVEYTWIIPKSAMSEVIIVKKENIYGWLDIEYQFHSGFPNDQIRKYVMSFGFLPAELTLDQHSQTMCEIPSGEYAASGILMPPSYLTSFGLMNAILEDFSIQGETSSEGYLGSREYLKAGTSFLENVSNHIGALVTSFTSRYLEGREEFYKYRNVSFVNDKNEFIYAGELSGYGEISIRKIDSSLLEIKNTPLPSDVSDFLGDEQESEWIFPSYKYYMIGEDNSITEVKTSRSFEFTEMVKIDSSYLNGVYVRWNPEIEGTQTYNFPAATTIINMRNEILAVYGYQFEDPKMTDYFQYSKWYQPRFNSYSQFASEMNDIDKHNLAFLEKIVGTLDPSYSASIK